MAFARKAACALAAALFVACGASYGEPAPIDGGSGSGTEDCTNGKDDDGNGLVDCADPACACVAPAPPGWTGPVIVGEGAAAPPCPPSAPLVVHEGNVDLVAPLAVCSACTCGTPNVADCRISVVFADTSSVACGGCNDVVEAAAGVCTVIDRNTNCGSPRDSARDPKMTDSADCAAQGGAALIDPPKWRAAIRACGNTGNARQECSGATTCAARPPAGFRGPCIVSAGDVSCPAAYPTRSVAYKQLDDSRACSACSCSKLQCSSGGVTLEMFSNAQCSAPSGTKTGATCELIPAEATHFRLAPALTGQCEASGGASAGQATGLDPTTICCL